MRLDYIFIRDLLLPTTMRITIPIAAFVTVLPFFVQAQTASDVWLTKWDRSSLFAKKDQSLTFAEGTAASGDANIKIDETTKYQVMDGFGAGLSTRRVLCCGCLLLAHLLSAADSSAKVLNDLKVRLTPPRRRASH